MTDPEGSRREFVADARINARVIPPVTAHRVRPKKGGQPFVIGDLLQQGRHRGPGTLENLLVDRAVAEVGSREVFRRDLPGEPIVFPEKQGVKGDQSDLLIASHITRREEGILREVERIGVAQPKRIEGKKVPVRAGLDEQFPSVKGPQRLHPGAIRTVDVGSVDKGGDEIDLFPDPGGARSGGDRDGPGRGNLGKAKIGIAGFDLDGEQLVAGSPGRSPGRRLSVGLAQTRVVTEELAELEEQLIQTPFAGKIPVSLVVHRVADPARTDQSLFLDFHVAVSFVFIRNAPGKIEAISVAGSGQPDQGSVGRSEIGV